MSVQITTTKVVVTTTPVGVDVEVEATPVVVEVAPPAVLAGSLPVVVATAQTALSGGRAVSVAGGNAQYADPVSQPRAVGITLGAAAQGAAATVQTSGEMIEPGWNWMPGPVFLGDNGALVQVPPVRGAVVALGEALGQQRLLIRVQPPIQRA